MIFLQTGREGNVFRSVCQLFCTQRGGSARGEVCLQGSLPGEGGSAYAPRYRHLVAATVVAGTHPTGMHSCFILFCIISRKQNCCAKYTTSNTDDSVRFILHKPSWSPFFVPFKNRFNSPMVVFKRSKVPLTKTVTLAVSVKKPYEAYRL